MRKLQSIVQVNSKISSSDKLKSQQLLESCENTLSTLFKLPVKEVIDREGSHSLIELNALITAAAFDSKSVFEILDSLPVLVGMKATSFTRRNDNGLVRNDFTTREGLVRGEFNCGEEVFFIIQYPDSNYTCTKASNVTVL